MTHELEVLRRAPTWFLVVLSRRIFNSTRLHPSSQDCSVLHVLGVLLHCFASVSARSTVHQNLVTFWLVHSENKHRTSHTILRQATLLYSLFFNTGEVNAMVFCMQTSGNKPSGLIQSLYNQTRLRCATRVNALLPFPPENEPHLSHHIHLHLPWLSQLPFFSLQWLFW